MFSFSFFFHSSDSCSFFLLCHNREQDRQAELGAPREGHAAPGPRHPLPDRQKRVPD